jgi:hypothetical protein
MQKLAREQRGQADGGNWAKRGRETVSFAMHGGSSSLT